MRLLGCLKPDLKNVLTLFSWKPQLWPLVDPKPHDLSIQISSKRPTLRISSWKFLSKRNRDDAVMRLVIQGGDVWISRQSHCFLRVVSQYIAILLAVSRSRLKTVLSFFVAHSLNLFVWLAFTYWCSVYFRLSALFADCLWVIACAVLTTSKITIK